MLESETVTNKRFTVQYSHKVLFPSYKQWANGNFWRVKARSIRL